LGTKGVRRVLPDSVARNDLRSDGRPFCRIRVVLVGRRVHPSDFIIETRARRASPRLFRRLQLRKKVQTPVGDLPIRPVAALTHRSQGYRSSSIDGMRISGSGIARVRPVHRDGVGSSFSDLLERLARAWLSIRHLIHAHVT